MKPRRSGRVREYQDGHWLMYVTRWDGMSHVEVEVWLNEARLVWRTTDPSKIDGAIAMFHDDPEAFAAENRYGELPGGKLAVVSKIIPGRLQE